MGKKISVYLSSEALANLDEIQQYLASLTGVPISRSSAMNVLLVKGAGLFMEDRRECQAAVARYTPGGKGGGGVGDE